MFLSVMFNGKVQRANISVSLAVHISSLDIANLDMVSLLEKQRHFSTQGKLYTPVD